MIRLAHPANGWHVLSPFDSLARLQAEGWVIEEPSEQAVPAPAETNAGAREVAQLPSPSNPPAEAPAPDTIESLRARLDARGIKYDKRWGLARLQSTLDPNG